MTWRVGTSLRRPALETCGAEAAARWERCGAARWEGCGGARHDGARHDPRALNGIGARGPNRTKESHGGESRSPATPARSLWASILVAVVAVAIVLGAELWAARRAPAPDGTMASEVATEVSETLGDVAASSVLIGPSD